MLPKCALQVTCLAWGPIPAKIGGKGQRELLATAAGDKKLKLWMSPVSPADTEKFKF